MRAIRSFWSGDVSLSSSSWRDAAATAVVDLNLTVWKRTREDVSEDEDDTTADDDDKLTFQAETPITWNGTFRRPWWCKTFNERLILCRQQQQKGPQQQKCISRSQREEWIKFGPNPLGDSMSEAKSTISHTFWLIWHSICLTSTGFTHKRYLLWNGRAIGCHDVSCSSCVADFVYRVEQNVDNLWIPCCARIFPQRVSL